MLLEFVVIDTVSMVTVGVLIGRYVVSSMIRDESVPKSVALFNVVISTNGVFVTFSVISVPSSVAAGTGLVSVA